MRWSSGYVRAKVVQRLLSAIVLGFAVGCAATPYQYCGDLHTEHDASLAVGEPQIERGRPLCVVDSLGWVVGVPSKLLMLDHRINNHDISPRTELTMQEYLIANRLDNVKVRLNEYDPLGEWERLARNESVGWPIRYTVGAVTVRGLHDPAGADFRRRPIQPLHEHDQPLFGRSGPGPLRGRSRQGLRAAGIQGLVRLGRRGARRGAGLSRRERLA